MAPETETVRRDRPGWRLCGGRGGLNCYGLPRCWGQRIILCSNSEVLVLLNGCSFQRGADQEAHHGLVEPVDLINQPWFGFKLGWERRDPGKVYGIHFGHIHGLTPITS